jgi:hypothetical protein
MAHFEVVAYPYLFGNKSSRLALAFVALLLICGEGLAAAQSMLPPEPPSDRHVLYAPIAGTADFDFWEIVLVSNEALPEPATLTLYASDGKPYPSVAIPVDANQTKTFNIRTILRQIGEFQVPGGIAIEYFGHPSALLAQIVLRAYHGFGSLDVPLMEATQFASNTLDAVWWEPAAAQSFLVLGNSSAKTLHVDLSFGENLKQNVVLSPFATTIQPVLYGAEPDPDGRIPSLHIAYSGVPGDLRAFAYSASISNGFFQTIRFFDPGEITGASLYANGLHIGDGPQHLVVKNIGQSAVMVSGSLYLLGAPKSERTLPIVSTAIAAGESRELELPQAPASLALDGAAIKLESSGGSASMTAAFSSFDPIGQIAQSVPFKDIGSYGVSTGRYPWRLDGDHSSRVYITNVGKVRAAMGGYIHPTAGKDYWIDTRYLEVGETAVFDLRDLRDQQTPDPRGVKLAKNVMAGQFEWTTLFGDGSQRLIGRAEEIDPSGKASVIVDTDACDCPSETLSAFFTPDSLFTTIGEDGYFTTTGVAYPACGGSGQDYTIDPTSFSINTPGIFSLKGGASSAMLGLAAGTSSFTTPVKETIYGFARGACYVVSQSTFNVPGTGTVQVPTSLQFVSATILQTGNSGNHGCTSGYYGIGLDIDYQVLDQNSNPIQSSAMTPQEYIVCGRCPELR